MWWAADIEGWQSRLPLTLTTQALLTRHETYIADSERDRKAMMEQIEILESAKHALEEKNTEIIAENRDLLDQLEQLNTSLVDSDAHVKNLQATLLSTQQELRKLSHLAARTEMLEREVANFEKQQANWEDTMSNKEDSEKSAIRRWQQAERTLTALEDQIERIEREAKEEKERHEDIVGRMERRHAVETELGSSARRSKDAVKLNQSDDRPNVVSHFVKDILQDNANLQLGIVELREMLNTSNEEVENLRSRLQFHQPADDDDDEETPKRTNPRYDLRDELNRATSQELHVHHHYHAPPSTPRLLHRAIKKKRIGMPSPSSVHSAPRLPTSIHGAAPSEVILQGTSATVPYRVPADDRTLPSRQPFQSHMLSSGCSSPHSTTYRTSSIFERVFSEVGQEDSSRPTTPDDEPCSPTWSAVPINRRSQVPLRNSSAPTVHDRGISPAEPTRPPPSAIFSIEELPRLEQDMRDPGGTSPTHATSWRSNSSRNSACISPTADEPPGHLQDVPYYYRPSVRRATSHDSLLSVSGMDIQTLRSRPSQLLAPYAHRGITSEAAICGATAHATRPITINRAPNSGKNLLSGVASGQRLQTKASSSTLGKKVGGWVLGRWGGVAPAATGDVATSLRSGGSAERGATGPGAPFSTLKQPRLRPPGINQMGPIMGFQPEKKIVFPPVVEALDEEALKDTLGGR